MFILYPFLIYHTLTVSGGLLGQVGGPSQGFCLNTGQHEHIRNARTYTHTPNIHALSGIPTHEPSVRASEDSSCLRPLGYRDRPYVYNGVKYCLSVLETVGIHVSSRNIQCINFSMFVWSFNRYLSGRLASVANAVFKSTDILET
jgi:hypothetical protein